MNDEEREKLAGKDAYRKSILINGKDFTDEMVDFSKFMQDNISKEMGFVSMNATVEALVSNNCAIFSTLMNISCNTFMAGAFFYRRWLIEHDVDVQSIEENALAKGQH
jgi:hypothetical protein